MLYNIVTASTTLIYDGDTLVGSHTTYTFPLEGYFLIFIFIGFFWAINYFIKS